MAGAPGKPAAAAPVTVVARTKPGGWDRPGAGEVRPLYHYYHYHHHYEYGQWTDAIKRSIELDLQVRPLTLLSSSSLLFEAPMD